MTNYELYSQLLFCCIDSYRYIHAKLCYCYWSLTFWRQQRLANQRQPRQTNRSIKKKIEFSPCTTKTLFSKGELFRTYYRLQNSSIQIMHLTIYSHPSHSRQLWRQSVALPLANDHFRKPPEEQEQQQSMNQTTQKYSVSFCDIYKKIELPLWEFDCLILCVAHK